ncbi:MAG: MFS transporter, partial [Nocardioidaceae bacterium]
PRGPRPLGGRRSGRGWVVGGYSRAAAAHRGGAGAAGDAVGHRRLLLAGLAVFGIGSTGCALAGNAAALVAGRVVQGVGVALLRPATLAVLARTFPAARDRARALAAWAGISGLALPLGPLVGGALVEAYGWQSIFWLNLPPLVVAGVATVRLLPAEPLRGMAGRLDLAGQLCATGFLVSVVYSLVEGPSIGWSRPQVLAGVVVAAVALAGFVRAESRAAPPMLPLHLFGHRVFRAANGVAVLTTAAMIGSIFPLTLYLQTVRGASPFAAGVRLAPMFVTFIAATALSGRLVAVLGTRRLVVGGMLAATAGIALFTRLTATSGYAVLAVALALLGVGIGVATPPMVGAALGALPLHQAGLASGVNNTARQVGPPLGVAVLGGLAGRPDAPGFVSGLHLAALVAAGLFLAAAALGTRLPSRPVA